MNSDGVAARNPDAVPACRPGRIAPSASVPVPRPRTITDEAILAATARVIGQVGPARLTLALVAQEAGISAPTLVQRFGSRRALLLRLVEQAPELARREADEARAATPSPLEAAKRLLLAMAQMAHTAQSMAHHLAFLQMDLDDPEFRRHARAHALAQERQLAVLFQLAMDEGELRHGDAAALARTMLAVASGALIRWAIVRRGTARACLADELAVALAPWSLGPQVTSAGKRRSGAGARGSSRDARGDRSSR